MEKLSAPIAFKSFTAMLKALPDDAACREYLESKVWRNGEPTCPHCTSKKHYVLKAKGEFKGMYKCGNCKKRYTVTIGTMFEGSHIGLRQWFIAIYIFSMHKKGISSHQLASDLGITQKSAWYMLHRIRLAFGMGVENLDQLGGEGVIVEVDETIVGGKADNFTNKRRKALTKENGIVSSNNKTHVIGCVERGGKLKMQVVPDGGVKPVVYAQVDTDSILSTDGGAAYPHIAKKYAAHGIVDHNKREYVNGIFHTNTLEGAFSWFDRMVIGVYHSISPKHMQAYCDEHAFRYNNRKQSVNERFDFSLRTSKKLPYATLIGSTNGH